MATKVNYSSTARTPRYGIVQAPKQKTYATLAQPATQPINPLYRAMAASSAASPADSLGMPGRIQPGQSFADIGTGALVQPPRLTPAAGVDTGGGAGAGTGSSGGGTGGGGAAGGGSTFDITSDPILAQIKALGEKSVGDAETGALALKKQALIRSGFGDLATSLLGDTGTAAAANQNPSSTLAQLLFAHQQRQQGIDQASNSNNTFYGSAHANQLGDEARQFELDQANAQNALYDLLGQADQGVLSARQHAQDQYAGELPGAYSRFLTQPPPATDPSGDGAGATDPNGGGANTGLGLLSAPDYLTALALAAAKRRRPVAV